MSFRALTGRALKRVCAGTSTGAPVAGFLAVRASLAVLLKTTIPGTVIS